MTRILAISGSLRARSSNSALIRAAALLAAGGVQVEIYEGLAALPPFNPDLDVEPEDPAVADFRRALQLADAVLISTPEYAHGVPGVLKNALDWVVGSGELIDKPVALINASPRATYAFASLAETITVMSGRIVKDASIAVALPPGHDASAICADATLAGPLRAAIERLAREAAQAC